MMMLSITDVNNFTIRPAGGHPNYHHTGNYPATHPVTENLNTPPWVLCVQWSASISRKINDFTLGFQNVRNPGSSTSSGGPSSQQAQHTPNTASGYTMTNPWWAYYYVQWSVTDINDFTLRQPLGTHHLPVQGFNMGWVLVHVICRGC